MQRMLFSGLYWVKRHIDTDDPLFQWPRVKYNKGQQLKVLGAECHFFLNFNVTSLKKNSFRISKKTNENQKQKYPLNQKLKPFQKQIKRLKSKLKFKYIVHCVGASSACMSCILNYN